jgi:hypothetical protein
VRTTHLAELFLHLVGTAGDAVPTQRTHWLGGNGTLPSLPLLAFGGTQLVFGEARYTVPVRLVKIRYLGNPTIAGRWIVGTAGTLDRLPAPVHNVGVRASIGVLRAEYLLDPSGKGRRTFQVGLGLVR